MPVMRRMTWATMSEADRQALCDRGLTAKTYVSFTAIRRCEFFEIPALRV